MIAPCEVVCAIKDFGNGVGFLSLKDYYYAKKSHQDIYDLIVSMDKHYNIPSTFDGTHPEFTFGDVQQPRLLIGQRYLVPDKSGKEISGTLEDAIIDENKCEVIGIYKADSDNRRIIVKGPISKDELMAYRRNPEIFFGVKKYVGKQLEENDSVGLFEFFLEGFIKISKEQLLDVMKESQDIEHLKTLDQEELAVTRAERLTLGAMVMKSNKGKT